MRQLIESQVREPDLLAIIFLIFEPEIKADACFSLISHLFTLKLEMSIERIGTRYQNCGYMSLIRISAQNFIYNTADALGDITAKKCKV